MIKVWFDGSCMPNPGGVIGYGAIIKRHEEIIYEISKRANISPEKSTNNVAEYCACIASMKYLIHHNLQANEVYMFGDSQLVIKQMRQEWQIGDGKYAEYADMAQQLLPKFSNITFEWIPREKNTGADLLARRGSGFFR